MRKKLKHGVPTTRLDFLRRVPMFAGLPDEVLARIDSHLDEVDWPAGHPLTVEGTGSYEAFIVAEGTAEVAVGGKVVGRTEVGELIGEVGLLQHARRSATVTATTPVRLLVVNPRDMAWLFEDPTLAARVQENLTRHLRGREVSTDGPGGHG